MFDDIGPLEYPPDEDQEESDVPKGYARQLACEARTDGKAMNQSRAEAIVARLLSNAAGLKYGSVAITVRIHDSRVVEVVYATTESTREAESNATKAKQ